MSAQQVVIGQVVTSAAGHDNGTPYMVLAVTDRYVFLANGRERSVLKPKKKNIRHVKVHKAIDEAMAERLRSGLPVTDESVRQAIAILYTG